MCTNMHVSLHELHFSNSHPNKTAEKVIHAYLQHIHATFGGSLTQIMNNGKEFKNELFQKAASEPEIKHQFLNPYHPQSNGIIANFNGFLKACASKYTHGKFDW